MGLFNFRKSENSLPFPGMDVREFSKIGRDLEAEMEISKAIEAIKLSENRPLFLSLFKRKKRDDSRHDMNIVFRPDAQSKDTIYSLLISARRFLNDFNLEQAKKDYAEIIRIYSSLSPDGQKQVYDDVKDLYNERKSAEYLNSR